MLSLPLSLAGGHGLPATPSLDETTRQKVLDRDGCACAFCGFVSKKYQIVRPKPVELTAKSIPDWGNTDNWVTACIFCDQVLRVDEVPAMKSGVLIWLPEFSQAELHHLVRAVYVARISQGGVADAARRVLDVLLSRREEAIKRIKTDDPTILSLVLRDYVSRRAYAERAAKLEGIRLLPLDRRMVREGELEFNQFPQILAYWRSKDGAFGQFMPNTWGTAFTELMAA